VIGTVQKALFSKKKILILRRRSGVGTDQRSWSRWVQVPVHFMLYHEYEDCAAIGNVDKVHPYTRTFLIDGERLNGGSHKCGIRIKGNTFLMSK
jgi:hypothetical protein